MGRIVAMMLVGLLVFVGMPGSVRADNYDTEITAVAQSVSTAISKAQKKKISVLDFTDLQGNANELGRFLAEELSVNLVMGRTDYAVLDRANLKNILAEHKLTESGLVNPENAKKLGQFAGVDAIVLGNITPLNDTIVLSVKIIATDTAEIVGAARGRITKTKELEELAGHGVAAGSGGGVAGNVDGSAARAEFSAPTTVYKFPNFTVELLSFQRRPDHGVLATLQITNTSKQTVLALAANQGGESGNIYISARLVDGAGNMIRCKKIEGLLPLHPDYVGAELCSAFEAIRRLPSRDWTKLLTELAPGENLRCTLEFGPAQSAAERPSDHGRGFKLQWEVISTERSAGHEDAAPKLNNVYLDHIVPAK